MKFPDFKVSTKEYSVECEQKWTAGDDDKFFYELKERKGIMARSVFNKDNNLDQMKQPMFFGEDLQVQQYSDMKYPIFDKVESTTTRLFLETRRDYLYRKIETIMLRLI